MADDSTPILGNPIRLLDLLTTVKQCQFGNTPRPGKSEKLFMTGMNTLQKKQYAEARDLFSKSAHLAAKEAAASHTPQSPASAHSSTQSESPSPPTAEQEHKEAFACSVMMLAYSALCCSTPSEATPLYIKALGAWEHLLGSGNVKCTGLIADIVQLLYKQDKFEEAMRYTKKGLAAIKAWKVKEKEIEKREMKGEVKEGDDGDFLTLELKGEIWGHEAFLLARFAQLKEKQGDAEGAGKTVVRAIAALKAHSTELVQLQLFDFEQRCKEALLDSAKLLLRVQGGTEADRAEAEKALAEIDD